jgi:hypothetical protein
MPTRVIEAVLSAESTMENKRLFDPSARSLEKDLRGTIDNLPFLSIESDGNPFPQIIEARIEAFCLQVERLHKKLKSGVNHLGSAHHAKIHIRDRRGSLVAG